MTERQKEILISSIKLAAKNGIQAITMKNIAREIGVSEPALYRHYDSKKEIILGILYLFEEITEIGFDAKAKTYTPVEKIKLILSGRIGQFGKFPEIAYIMLCFDIFMHDDELRSVALKIITKHIEGIKSLILEGQESGVIRKDSGPEELFMLIVGPFRLLLTRWFLNNYSFDLNARFEGLWKTICSAIKA